MKKQLPDGTIIHFLDYQDGPILHNEFGPAVEHPNGDVEFWMHGIRLNYSIEIEDGERILKSLKTKWNVDYD